MAVIPEPIFKVKKNVDVFKLYGSENIIDNTDTKDGCEDECISEDLQSMRIRLAVMKAKEQCEKENEESTIRQEAIDEVDANLREIIALESPFQMESKIEKSNTKGKKSLVKKKKPLDEPLKTISTSKDENDQTVG